MEKVLVTNIQRFSLHDGPGIRTTIFFKGCPLRCPWCSNPENLNAYPQIYLKDRVKGIYGKWYTPDELYVEIVKDRIFYDNKEERLRGGVTFSGGEALLQMEKLKPLLRRLKFEGIDMAIETCLFTSSNMPQQEDALTIALNLIDLFYIDIKILDEKRCKEILHGDINLYLSNLERVLYKGKSLVLRIPVIGGYTDLVENRKAVASLIRNIISRKESSTKILKIELIKEHSMGLSKYESLAACDPSIQIPQYMGVSDDIMDVYKKELTQAVGYGLSDNKMNRKIPIEICQV